MREESEDSSEKTSKEEFGGLLRYTVAGFTAGIAIGALLDFLGFQRSAVGQWIVRTLSGESESIFEGIYALRRRWRGAKASMAESYAWGKFFGMAAPWFIDWGSRVAGVDVYGVQGFYIPYFYALSDQIGANVSGLIFLRRQEGVWLRAISRYIRHPVMLTSLIIVLVVPGGLLAARLLGFSPTTQVYTALETVAANLCWVPPLVGWLKERRR